VFAALIFAYQAEIIAAWEKLMIKLPRYLTR
jgi:hypothetical protein